MQTLCSLANLQVFISCTKISPDFLQYRFNNIPTGCIGVVSPGTKKITYGKRDLIFGNTGAYTQRTTTDWESTSADFRTSVTMVSSFDFGNPVADIPGAYVLDTNPGKVKLYDSDGANMEWNGFKTYTMVRIRGGSVCNWVIWRSEDHAALLPKRVPLPLGRRSIRCTNESLERAMIRIKEGLLAKGKLA